MHTYNDAHGRLPPAAVCGKDGRPLLSWRVLLLPYIEQDQLYREFRLDEPWDSPHNLALLPRMPATYAPPRYKRSKAPPYHTFYHVFVGKGAAFEHGKTVSLQEINEGDGTSNTLLVVEAGPPSPWTKPEDLPFDPDGPLPDLRGPFRDGFRAGLADGSMRWVGNRTSEAALRAAITRNGGEQIGFEE